MRQALVVGINHYENVPPLYGCVNDAYAVKNVVSDGTVNFDVRLLSSTGQPHPVLRSELKESIRELFSGDSDTALFYFSGHGHIDDNGGYLVSSDAKTGHDGIPLGESTLANHSAARNRVIVLDCCLSGIAGAIKSNFSKLRTQRRNNYSYRFYGRTVRVEKNGAGVFTTLFVDALNGAAGNLVGDVTPGSVYAHIDQSLGPWAQRPVFKTNVKSFVSLRKVQPPIGLRELQRITEFFPSPGFEISLIIHLSQSSQADHGMLRLPTPKIHTNLQFFKSRTV